MTLLLAPLAAFAPAALTAAPSALLIVAQICTIINTFISVSNWLEKRKRV